MPLDIDENNKHPYTDTMARYHWLNNQPFVYTNSKGSLVQQWVDGRIDYLVDDDTKHSTLNDKRYEQPFEDDGAYAD